jgi:carboxylesterase type B
MESQQTSLVADGKLNYEKVLSHFGCSTLECIRGVSGTDIQAYVNSAGLTAGFPPVEGDGTYTSNVLPSILSGKFANVPVMAGTNLDEFRVFLQLLGLGSDADLAESVSSITGFNISAIEPALLKKYSAEITKDSNAILSR